ncbi:uncharacterized protein [Diabrotica undecimpunctata]|uniref:uncharacterized protein n=1 Tax=Diabrotica undecimpunctata TaxID=50387 RepID=UPI003B63B66C
MVQALQILATLLALQLSYGDPQHGYPIHLPYLPPDDCDPYPPHYPHPIPEPACEIPVIPHPLPSPHHPPLHPLPPESCELPPVVIPHPHGGPIWDYDDCDYPYPGYLHGPAPHSPLPPHLPPLHPLPLPEPCDVPPVIVPHPHGGPIWDYDDCDYPYPGYPHGPAPHPLPLPEPCDVPPVVIHHPSPPSPHRPPYHPLPVPEPCDGLPDWLDAWPNEWPRYFPGGWPDGWPCDFPLGLPHDWPHDFPHGLPHDWPKSFPHGWRPNNLPQGYPNAWPCDWPENWCDYWPDCWPNYWNDCDLPLPGHPHGPFPVPPSPRPLPLAHNLPSPHPLPLPEPCDVPPVVIHHPSPPSPPRPPYHPLPVPEPCDGLPDWLDAWPNEWPRYFPGGWPDDWPCDFPLGLPHDWPHDFPHGLPHDWPNSFPHGWRPNNLPHGYPNAWPCDWPENWRDYWPDCWPNYWNDCDLPRPGYPHGPFPSPRPLPLAHNLPSPHYHPSLPVETCDVISYPHGLPHDLPHGFPHGWPNEWPRHFPNGWPDDWPCDFPRDFIPDGPHDFPHGFPHDWPNNFPHGWPVPHGYPNDYPCEWPDNWHDYWPDCWPNYWDGCDYPYPAGSVPAIPPPAENCEVFPKEFSFGVASGAYHIEGAWDQDCKSENIWDRWLHTCPSVVIDGSNGDISADAYNHIKGDIEILNNLTVRHYVFSISWSSVIYDGCGDVNPYGIEHYRTLIKLLKLNHIEPIVVLYYGDLPQSLEDQGGFLCSSFVEWYTEYARVCFEYFGDDVKYWITFHKPTTICKDGYGLGTFAPGINDGPGNYEYICGHNLLKAHAAAYHLYDDYYRPCQNGKISITLNSDWYEPQSACDTDVCAAETKLQFQIGWFAHPIYIGDYPEIMIERIRLNCDYNGYYNARLPVFSHAEIEYIKGTHDFFSLAYESAFYVTAAADNCWGNICYESDVGVQLVGCDGEFLTCGIRQLLGWISRNYYNPSVFITNDGYGTCSRDCYDCDRIEYIKAILRNVRLSMIEDYTRVYGYTYYSYIDGFEWNLIDGRLAGYTLKYGLYDVEFDCPQKTRTARSSAAYYQHLASTGCIEDPCPSPYYYYHY